MEPEELDPDAFDAALLSAKTFLSGYGVSLDEQQLRNVVSASIAAFMAAGGMTEENAVRWREGLKQSFKPPH